MKNNFDLKKFLTENKFTHNSKRLTELKDVEDGRDIGEKIKEFAGGMNVDINIDYQRGKTKDFKDVPVEKAIDIVNQYIDQNDLTQACTDETNRILQVDDGDTAIDITKAGMSEIDADLLKRAQNTPAPKDATAQLAKRKANVDSTNRKVLKVSMGKNAEQEQKVIDIARDAIALMDEQPKTSAVEALKSVLGI